MLRPRAFDFYTFATYIHPITEVKAGTPFKGNSELISLFANVEGVTIIFYMDEFCKKYLPSSTATAEQLYNFISTCFSSSRGVDKLPDTVRDVDVNLIREVVKKFETVLEDELSKLPIFCCDDDKIGNFSIDKLIKGGSNGYPASTKIYGSLAQHQRQLSESFNAPRGHSGDA
jgi:hypothetical protein